MSNQSKKEVFIKYLSILGLFLMLFSLPYSVTAQDNDDEEENCELSTNKKAIKAYEKGIDKKKFNYRERMTYLNEAIDLDPDFTIAIWSLTFSQIKQARVNYLPYQKKEAALKTVVENCPQIHSAPYFFLGEINMNKGQFEAAADYYNKFIHFESDDEKKFERRYEEQLANAQEKMKLAAFLGYQYANPQPFQPVKLLPLSQEDSDEYLPAISPDNEVMLYTRKIEVKNNSRDGIGASTDRTVLIERFSMSNLINGEFEKGQAFGAPFNMDHRANYGGAAISIDNREIYYTECTPIQGKMNCDIYYSRYEYSSMGKGDIEAWHWTKPESLGPNINTEDGWEAQPTVSKDGQWLMYAVYRKGTRGIDIFQSKLQANGTWGPGENMGEPINTSGNEKSPFFHSDDKTLYFASKDGHMGMGGYDVFISKFEDGKWTTPLNLGYPLNSVEDEHGYIVSLDGKTAYFGSAAPIKESKGKSIDLYQVTLPKKVRPEKVMMVTGSVKTVDGEIPEDAVIELRNTKTQEVEEVKVDAMTGKFSAIVNVEDTADYMVTAKGENLAFNNKLVKAPEPDAPVKTKMKVEVQEAKMGQHITIENIHFKTNSADIDDESKASLDALVAYMKAHDDFKVSVEGHTDNVGDKKANLALSTDRAYSVMAYLQESGISSKHLKFKGWGSDKPIVSNSSANGRAMNRRIEIVVLEM